MGDQLLIRNFNIDIKGGEVMCLLGNNGSGKTTLINLLTGLMKSDQGSGDALLRIDSESTYVSL
jgi:ABC-type multidrug transport system ATPase subunit